MKNHLSNTSNENRAETYTGQINELVASMAKDANYWTEKYANSLQENDRLRSINAELIAALQECISEDGSGATKSHQFAIRRLGYISDIARSALKAAS